MPTQKRDSPPANVGRFTYYEYMRPSRFVLSPRAPAQQLIRRQFQFLLTAPEDVVRDVARRQAVTVGESIDWDMDREEDPIEYAPWIKMNLVKLLRNRPFHALQFLVEHDKEWNQYAPACAALARLPKPKQKALNLISRRKWHRKSQWSWNRLLQRIAIDQKFFREVLIDGPAKAGLVESKRVGNEPLWKKYGISQATGRRIYNTYGQQLSRILGEGVRAAKGLQAHLTKIGYLDAQGRFEGRPIESFLEGKPSRERKRHTDLAIHAFAHALRNLQNWRYGKRPLPWTSYACMKACLDLQQQLAQRPPS